MILAAFILGCFSFAVSLLIFVCMFKVMDNMPSSHALQELWRWYDQKCRNLFGRTVDLIELDNECRRMKDKFKDDLRQLNQQCFKNLCDLLIAEDKRRAGRILPNERLIERAISVDVFKYNCNKPIEEHKEDEIELVYPKIRSN